jgi:hypothetical protein
MRSGVRSPSAPPILSDSLNNSPTQFAPSPGCQSGSLLLDEIEVDQKRDAMPIDGKGKAMGRQRRGSVIERKGKIYARVQLTDEQVRARGAPIVHEGNFFEFPSITYFPIHYRRFIGCRRQSTDALRCESLLEPKTATDLSEFVKAA